MVLKKKRGGKGRRAKGQKNAGGKKKGIDISNFVKGLSLASSDIIHKAATILEEEIAAGIVAAKEVEDKFIDDKVKKEDTGELLYRFRRDAHEVLDMVINLIQTAVNSIDKIDKKKDK